MSLIPEHFSSFTSSAPSACGVPRFSAKQVHRHTFAVIETAWRLVILSYLTQEVVGFTATKSALPSHVGASAAFPNIVPILVHFDSSGCSSQRPYPASTCVWVPHQLSISSGMTWMYSCLVCKECTDQCMVCAMALHLRACCTSSIDEGMYVMCPK